MRHLIILALALCLLQPSLAEGLSKGGDDFRDTAYEYEKLAQKYKAKGMSDVSAIYKRMAEIKIDAAEKADRGEWKDIDWSEYHELEDKVNEFAYSKH